MAEGYTSSFDPVTGQRKETRFEYEPVQAQDTMPSQSISPAQMAEVYKYFFTQTKNPSQAVEAANDYIDAARQFKGRMLYQQMAREGRLTPENQAKIAEDMFARNAKDLATVRKSFMPPKPTPPRIMSVPGGGIVSIDPTTQGVKELRAPTTKPQAPIIRSSNGGLFLVDPVTQTAKPLTPPKAPTDYAAVEDRKMAAEKYKTAAGELEALGPRKEPGLFGLGGNVSKIEAAEKARNEARAKLQGSPTATGTLSEQAATKASGPETIRFTKDGRKAIFDSTTKQFLRYAD